MFALCTGTNLRVNFPVRNQYSSVSISRAYSAMVSSLFSPEASSLFSPEASSLFSPEASSLFSPEASSFSHCSTLFSRQQTTL